MKQLLEQIDKYLSVQEEKDAISLSLSSNKDIQDIIEIVRNSEDRDRALTLFSDDIREQIQKLIDGGIL